MMIDKIYCAKAQRTYELHKFRDQVRLVSGNTVIENLYDIAVIISEIEHKPNHKLFKSRIDVANYLKERLGLTL